MTKTSEVYTMDTWQELIKAMHSCETIEINEEVWFYWLEVLPPVYMNQEKEVAGVKRRCSFGFAEGIEPITDFWREGNKYFCRRSNRIHHGG